MQVRITYRITKEITSDDKYKISVKVLSAVGITRKIFVHRGSALLYVAFPEDLELDPEDAPSTAGGKYRLEEAELIVDDVSSAVQEELAIRQRIDLLAELYQEQSGNFQGSEEVIVEYGT